MGTLIGCAAFFVVLVVVTAIVEAFKVV